MLSYDISASGLAVKSNKVPINPKTRAINAWDSLTRLRAIHMAIIWGIKNGPIMMVDTSSVANPANLLLCKEEKMIATSVDPGA